MATLPDLPTSQAGFVAYHNGLDNGATGVEPTNITGLDSISTYQQYDNGIRATYIVQRDLVPDFVLNVRAKTDGWLVLWLERGEQFYGTNNDSSGDLRTNNGDFFKKTKEESLSLGSNTNYSNATQDVSEAIFTGLDYSYSTDDVSIYHYNHPDATAVNNIYVTGNSVTRTLSYPSTIDRKAECINAHAGSEVGQTLDFNGNAIAGFEQFASLNSLEDGLTPDPSTNYTVKNGDNRSLFSLTAVFSQ